MEKKIIDTIEKNQIELIRRIGDPMRKNEIITSKTTLEECKADTCHDKIHQELNELKAKYEALESELN